MALNARDRRALILGGVGLGLLALYFGLLEPAAKAYDDLAAEHERLAGQVARTLHNNQKAEYYAERLKEYEQTAGELVQPKPYDEQITTIGEQIMTAAQKSGLQLRSSTPSAAAPWGDDPALELATFQIDAEVAWPNAMASRPGWENVFKFIGNLYRIPGVLSVERLDLTGELMKGKPNDPNVGGKISVRLTVSVLAAAPSSDRAPSRT
ncbi:MAG: type II secretion system protein M [Phycisphaerae bacterium]|nr:type II secretion system protein M [Phycisphaerae bacterium]